MKAHHVLPKVIPSLAEGIKTVGGRALIVGGAVRDLVLGCEPKDWDIEVYHVDLDTIIAISRNFGKVAEVGRAFGVLQLRAFDGTELDIALPRTEQKTGTGHKGFFVRTASDLSVEEASSRRDFTANAMSLDPLTGELIDPFGGREDMARGVLRHVGPQFAEDPLRVLRGAQFCARFNWRMAPETITLCRDLFHEAHTLPKERIWVEWKKLLLAPYPARGMEVLRETGWVHLWPTLADLIGTGQSPEHHPEGDVWDHTLLGMERIKSDLVLRLAILLHDVGKPSTTQEDFTAHGHAEAGVEPARRFLEAIGAPRDIRERVLPLVREHMFRGPGGDLEPTEKSVRRLARRLAPATVRELAEVIRADRLASGSKREGELPGHLLRVAERIRIADQAPKPIVMGRHLMAMGVAPGPDMGKILRRLFELQLDGVFSTVDEALSLVRGGRI